MDYRYTNEVVWLPNNGWDERIHIAANDDLVNVFLVITERYVVLVDTLFNATTATALFEHAQPYLDSRQLLVVNSHADWDHAWGNQIFDGPQALYPAPIIGHTLGATRLSAPESFASLRKFQQEEPTIFADVILTKPTLTFSYEMIIHGGDLSLHLFPTPGHTQDHIVIHIPEISTLLAGDAAELPFPYVYSSTSLPILRASLQKMADLQADVVLYCHAPPESGPQLIQDNIAYYNALEAACAAALARGDLLDGIPDAEVPLALNCDYAAVTPTGPAWEEVSQRTRNVTHGQQLRLMLAYLQQQELELGDS